MALGVLILSLRVDAEVIPFNAMRYCTSGDWYWSRGVLCIRVARLSHRRYEWLVGIHEVVEALACWWAGVDESVVTTFDIEFENSRERLNLPYSCEPGDEPNAPYYRQHQLATRIEKICARLFLVDWKDYEWSLETAE